MILYQACEQGVFDNLKHLRAVLYWNRRGTSWIALVPIYINKSWFAQLNHVLTLKHRDTHGCVVSTVTTDALVLKHQAISIHNAD